MAFLHDLYLRAGVGKQVESNCVVLVSFATKSWGMYHRTTLLLQCTFCWVELRTVQWNTNPTKRATSTFTAFPSRGRCREVDTIYREVSHSRLNWSTSCCLNQVDGDRELIEGDLLIFTIFWSTSRETLQQHIHWTYSVYSLHVASSAQVRGVRGDSYTSAPPPPLHLIRREWRPESGAMRCPDT